MTNGAKTLRFFVAISQSTQHTILKNIANHYGITTAAALDEVTHDQAENLLEYVTGPERQATMVIMQKNGFAPFS
jgi:uncharacterized phage-associated protein